MILYIPGVQLKDEVTGRERYMGQGRQDGCTLLPPSSAQPVVCLGSLFASLPDSTATRTTVTGRDFLSFHPCFLPPGPWCSTQFPLPVMLAILIKWKRLLRHTILQL